MERLPVILGSASSERLLLLKSADITPDEVLSVDLDESERKKEKPEHYCSRVAKEKFEAIAKIIGPKKAIVITADTTAFARGVLLHKAHSDEEIRYYISLISGSRHRVITAVYCGIVESNKVETLKSRVVGSTISMKRMTKAEIEHFVESKDGYGKAGGYTIKGVIGRYIKRINGSFSSILGIPLYETSQMIESLRGK